MNSTGYSGTPLAKKLGIKEGFKIRVVNPPAYYFDLFTDMPENITIVTDIETKKNFVHYFATKAKDLENNIALLKDEIEKDGIIWVSWYKKSSKIPSDVSEDFIRNLALSSGLVDIKVCAVDEVWSGLKLVIPVKDRV